MPRRLTFAELAEGACRPLSGADQRLDAAALAAALALLPLALGIGQGSAMQQPLAIAIIAGLAVQLPLVLLLVPVLYALLQRRGTAA